MGQRHRPPIVWHGLGDRWHLEVLSPSEGDAGRPGDSLGAGWQEDMAFHLSCAWGQPGSDISVCRWSCSPQDTPGVSPGPGRCLRDRRVPALLPAGLFRAQQPLAGASAQGKGAALCQHPNPCPQLPHRLSRLPWLPSLPCHLLTGCSLRFQLPGASSQRAFPKFRALFWWRSAPQGCHPSVLTAHP